MMQSHCHPLNVLWTDMSSPKKTMMLTNKSRYVRVLERSDGRFTKSRIYIIFKWDCMASGFTPRLPETKGKA